MRKELTEQQRKFLDVLFTEAGGDLVAAKKLAGYSETSSTADIRRSLRDEIIEATKEYLSITAAKAAVSLGSALNDPTELGLKEKLNAAKDILDRVGIIKTEKIQVEANNGVMILPAKNAE
jgi:phage terminase small subunit